MKNDNIIKIEEKPAILDSNFDNYAISGCYVFTNKYFDYFKQAKLSARGEYEITDIIKDYQKDGKLLFNKINGLWSDAGTHDSIKFVNSYLYSV